MTLLKLVAKSLKLISFSLHVFEVDSVSKEIIKVTVDFVKANDTLVTLVLSEGLYCRVNGGSRIIEENIELLQTFIDLGWVLNLFGRQFLYCVQFH